MSIEKRDTLRIMSLGLSLLLVKTKERLSSIHAKHLIGSLRETMDEEAKIFEEGDLLERAGLIGVVTEVGEDGFMTMTFMSDPMMHDWTTLNFTLDQYVKQLGRELNGNIAIHNLSLNERIRDGVYDRKLDGDAAHRAEVTKNKNKTKEES